MAETFAEDTDALREFGKATLAAEAANEAYYSAMASNAQQMLNLGEYSQEEILQMNNAIDSDRMKAMEDKYKNDFVSKSKDEQK
jgi:hypothetical protein